MIRTRHLFAALAVTVLFGGACKWSDFDDLQRTTWVRSTQSPDIGSSDYAVGNTTTGTLDTTPALSLHDADPESGHLFGRTVTTMNFNGEPIFVVGADSEVFAYYRTALYDHLP